MEARSNNSNDGVKQITKALRHVATNPDCLVREAARRNLLVFSRYMQKDMKVESYHLVYYTILDMFAKGKIKRLIVTMPPQHGKSEGSSRKIPAFILGQDPDKKIAIGSYAASHANDFNADVQKIIDTPEYRQLFPNTILPRTEQARHRTMYQRNRTVFECVGCKGGLRTVGRGGALTGKAVDVLILDDVYKDYEEASSPIIRESAWNWYKTVARSRLHNDSQELIVYTRWHSDDIVGRLEKIEEIIDAEKYSDLDNIPSEAWVRINFPAIKVGDKTEFDPRDYGTALWEQKHSLVKLMARRKLDKSQFECLYQGNPKSAEGRLYYMGFKTYIDAQEYGIVLAKGNYTDCADEGEDYICSICYDKVASRDIKDDNGNPMIFIIVTDVVFTNEPIEITSQSVPMMMNRERTQYANVESNGGGAAFAKIIKPRTAAKIEWFSQTKNKESRIMAHSGLVMERVIMPFDWKERWPKFYEQVTEFLRKFSANEHDDAPDALTGIIEKEVLNRASGIKRRN